VQEQKKNPADPENEDGWIQTLLECWINGKHLVRTRYNAAETSKIYVKRKETSGE
jgi:hypothetical protein